MVFNHRSRAVLLLGVALLSGGCRGLDIPQLQFAVINVPVVETESGHATSPVAFFFKGSGVQLPSTNVRQEGCVTLSLTNPGTARNLSYISAGPSVTATLSGNSASLTPRTDGQRTTYELEPGEDIPFIPGATITVAIPGASGGFPTLTVSARTSEFFQADTIVLASAGDLIVTWTPATLTGTAMFYAFRYGWEGSATPNRELACVFADDGTARVTEFDLTEFRQSTVRTVIAQRGTATTERIGNAVSHVLSTVRVEVPMRAAQ